MEFLTRSHLVSLLLLGVVLPVSAQAQKNALFDHTRHEEAGTSAQWVICTASEPDPSPASPASETSWNGGISAWGFDLFKAGYKVRTLPPTGRVTFHDSTNAMDLSNYQVYIIDEPYLKFTAAEKQAILSYVQNGGGLFIVCNHVGAARYSGTGGTDAYTVFNDMVNVGGSNPYGFTFVPGHGPGDAQANTTSTAFSTGTDAASQAIVHGAFGGLSMMDFHSYSYVSYNTSWNPSVKEILHTQVSGDTGSFIVTSMVGAGRVVAISDSAPADDGTTTTSGKSLHVSWPNNSNRAFFMNACAYLAGTGTANHAPVVSILSPSSSPSIPAGGSVSFQGGATDADGDAMTYQWAFGDGSTAAVQGPISHTYSSVGTFTATFTATDTHGASNSATCTVTVNPVDASYTLSATAGANGSINPSGMLSVSKGASQAFTITPNAGYQVGGVTVDGASVGAVSTYTFTNVTANHTIAATFAATAGSSFTETFNTGTKTAYATGNVALPSGTWTLNDALLGNTTSDRKNGAQSVRVRNSGKVTMAFNWATGAKVVSIKHGKYGTDANTTWGLWYSTNSGSTWTQAGSTVTTATTSLQTATFTVNITGAIRFEIRKTDGTANRVNLDDFQLSGY